MFDATALETSSGRMSQRSGRPCDAAQHRRGSTHKPRSVTLEVTALIIIALLLIAGALLTRGSGANAPDLSQHLRVQAGDSLWAVAATHPVEGMSTAQVVDLLADANDLRERGIRPGQIILVPTAELNERFASR